MREVEKLVWTRRGLDMEGAKLGEEASKAAKGMALQCARHLGSRIVTWARRS